MSGREWPYELTHREFSMFCLTHTHTHSRIYLFTRVVSWLCICMCVCVYSPSAHLFIHNSRTLEYINKPSEHPAGLIWYSLLLTHTRHIGVSGFLHSDTFTSVQCGRLNWHHTSSLVCVRVCVRVTFSLADGLIGCSPELASNLRPDNLIGIESVKHGGEGSEGTR